MNVEFLVNDLRYAARRLRRRPIVVMRLVLYAGDNPNLRCFIDSANRSLRSRQFDQAINDLIPALRVAKRERASNESVSAILSNLGYSCRMLGRCGDAVTALMEEMRGWDRGIVALDRARFAGINLLQSYLDCGASRSAARLWRKTLIPIARKLNPGTPALASLLAAGALATSAVRHYQESVNLYNEAITIWESGCIARRSKRFPTSQLKICNAAAPLPTALPSRCGSGCAPWWSTKSSRPDLYLPFAARNAGSAVLRTHFRANR